MDANKVLSEMQADPSTPAGFEVEVVACRDVATDVRYLELQRRDGHPLPAFEAGAHVDLHLGGLVRQYSLCNGPSDRGVLQLAVKLEPRSRGGSEAVHKNLKLGSVLTVTGPRNHFRLVESEAPAVLLAAGIGITPLLAMARTLRAGRKPFDLHYFARSEAFAAFHQELLGAGSGERARSYYGLTADRTAEALRACFDEVAEGSQVYICGPRPFMDAAIALAQARVGNANTHYEFFSADPSLAALPQDAFDVRCAKSGKTVSVPSGVSIADALSRIAVKVEVMCEQGVCGTCLTRVISGRPDHRDSFLTDEERESGELMLICCSRSRDPLLVLDI
ncbi:MAG: PDR/VanB family oxidoreductase [Burkholderiaceae bacterium]